MDRRAFMALLGLGPAFKRLVPAVVEPLPVPRDRWQIVLDHMGAHYRLLCGDREVGKVRAAYNPDDFRSPSIVDAVELHLRHIRAHVVPYATLPEETENA